MLPTYLYAHQSLISMIICLQNFKVVSITIVTLSFSNDQTCSHKLIPENRSHAKLAVKLLSGCPFQRQVAFNFT